MQCLEYKYRIQPATKKARAPDCHPQANPHRKVNTPARALGDLGRDQHGLFLVLHCDDVHMGLQSHSEVIAALKELYSAPGGGGGVGNSTSSAGSSLVGGVGLAGVG